MVQFFCYYKVAVNNSHISSVDVKEVFPIEQQNLTLTTQKRTYSVAEVMAILEISKKKAYELCKSGVFKSVRIGTTIRVSKSSFDEWLDKNNY